MKYGVWFFRLAFAAWMIPAGLNHFVEIFPQPMGSQPLSQELIVALIDSNLFDLVKAVELIAGVCVLFGWYTPLALLVCMPVSFCVFYWDAPLEGWGSRAALFGYSTFGFNIVLCLAYLKDYKKLFTIRTETQRKQLVLAGSIVLGGWMVLNGLNYLLLSMWEVPAGQTPLAAQLMTSLINSSLLDVAMVIQLVTGLLILARILVPLALCLLMPVTTCALYWALILDHQPLNIILALAAFALNGLLMLAHLPYYKDLLEKSSSAFGESPSDVNGKYDGLFVNPRGTTTRAAFIPAMLVVLATMYFFGHFVTGRTAQFCMLVLVYPGFVVLARRLQGLGQTLWLALIPLIPVLLYLGTLLGYVSLGESIDSIMQWLALAIAGAFIVWAGIGGSRSQEAT